MIRGDFVKFSQQAFNPGHNRKLLLPVAGQRDGQLQLVEMAHAVQFNGPFQVFYASADIAGLFQDTADNGMNFGCRRIIEAIAPEGKEQRLQFIGVIEGGFKVLGGIRPLCILGQGFPDVPGAFIAFIGKRDGNALEIKNDRIRLVRSEDAVGQGDRL